ncbi:MAG: PIN domain-containing protein [Bacteroidetes bacterium]|nr:PIN domain-containing protein [Bacteroidota bacterium]MCL5025567.1 PIN domain-containing protein [Chloroflexota bacterium]
MIGGRPIILLDTNVLVYAHDLRDKSKQREAITTLDILGGTQAGCISVQVLAEFYAVAIAKLYAHLSNANAGRQVELLSQAFPVVHLTAPIVLEAIRGVREHQLSYWDAQIWATAKLNQIPVVLSEDFTDGRTIEGVRFRNPFAPGFDLRSIVRLN